MPRKNKLSRNDCAIILARAAAGERYTSIARDYGVTGPAIRYIVRRGPSSPPPRPAPATVVPPTADSADRSGVAARLEAADHALALLADTLGQTRTLVVTLRSSLAGLRDKCAPDAR